MRPGPYIVFWRELEIESLDEEELLSARRSEIRYVGSADARQRIMNELT